MLLIADSGSTKTDWRIISQGKVLVDFHTEGINPYLMDENQILQIIDCEDIGEYSHQIMEIQYYGAGCARVEKQEVIKKILKEVFPSAKAQVYSDMLGAARGICGYASGIVSVLGTGSNACMYDGKNIIQQTTSLGYLLGDEGSGVFIGKRILQEYLYQKLPPSIQTKFDEKYKLSTAQIMDKLYTQYMPNRFMATFSEFANENIDHPYIYGLVYESFYTFINNHITQFKEHKNEKLNFVGSVADAYNEILQKVSVDTGFSFGKVIKSPLEGITTFHLHQSK